MLRVSEIFRSVQGEGHLTGTDSVFLRTSGCNLRCRWCDTPYASFTPEGVARPYERAVEDVLTMGADHVVVTGGEPLLPKDIVSVTAALASAGRHITVETAATVHRDVTCDLMSISPKRANSAPDGRWAARHEATRDRPAVVQEMLRSYTCQFKFVCAERRDVEDAVQYLDQFEGVDRSMVFLMPEGVDAEVLAERETWLRPAADREGLRYGRRLHVELFGDTRGT